MRTINVAVFALAISLVAEKKGRIRLFEVKTGKSRPTRNQRRAHAAFRRFGGVAFGPRAAAAGLASPIAGGVTVLRVR